MPTSLQNNAHRFKANPRLIWHLRHLLPIVMVAMWATLSPARIHADTTAATAITFVRLVQGSPDAPLLDVYVNGERITQAARYASISEYVPVKVSRQRAVVQMMQSGVKPSVQSSAQSGADGLVISGTFQLSAGQDYSLLTLGKVSKIGLQLLVDDNTIDAQGQAKVRLVHASADSPGIDIVTGNMSDQDQSPWFKNATYKTITPYSTVAPGAYSLLVRPAGTDANKLDVKGLFLELGSVTTIYAFGSWSGSPAFSLRLSTDLRPDVILPVTGADWSGS